jgi:hypothetical protein
MSAIPINPELQISEEVADFMLFLLNENRVALPKLSIKKILLVKARPGLSAEILAASITSRFPEAKIPNGPLGGGTPNSMEILIKIISEEIVEAIQSDMRVDVVTDPGATVTASGGNAGGPVVCVGATVAPHTGIGIAR